MFGFQFDFLGDVQFDRAFSRFGDSLESFTPVWLELQKSFYRKTNKVFVSQGSSNAGGAWNPLSAKYLKRKVKKFGNRPILEATRKLRKSLTNPRADGSVVVIEPTEFAIGTSLTYAKYHQFGTSKMPQRVLVAFTEQDRRDWTKAVQRALFREFRNQRILAGDDNERAENNS